MARGGYRPGAGRPRKTDAPAADRGKAPAEAKLIEEGKPKARRKKQTPLEYMVDVMNDPDVTEARRDRMALTITPLPYAASAIIRSAR